jgi:L-malate glycosyltransferase
VIVVNMCIWQMQQGHSVTLHSLFGLGPLVDRLEAGGVPYFQYPDTSRLGMMYQIWKKLHADRPDVVHCHNVSPTVHASWSAKFAGVQRIISTRHSLVSPPYDMRSEIQFSLAAACCDAVVGVCDATSTNLRNAPWAKASRVVTVYNGAPPAPSTNAVIPKPKDSFVFAHVARLNPVKDQHTLLKAFSVAVPRMRAPVYLWIVGGGESEAQLRRQAKDLGIAEQVIFWGQRQNAADYLRAADAFVLSSLSEGLPVSVLEAMAAQLPIIVTDVGGAPEIIRRFQNGVVVPPGNATALAQAMIEMTDDPETLRNQAKASKEGYDEQFTNDRMNRNYLILYGRGN